jgi:nucleotide-binding universal stress UspA family protein
VIGTIVVALDGSELAEQALPGAKQLAERMRIPIHLVQVIPVDASADRRDEVHRYLLETARELGQPVRISIRLGDPAEEIIGEADVSTEPIIVITTHGRGDLGRLLFGSVANQVAREATRPVLLVRAASPSTATRPFHSIMVPLDGSAYAEAVLPYATELARSLDADVWLIRVVETNYVTEDPALAGTLVEDYRRMVAEAGAYLDTLAEQLRGMGVRAHPRPLSGFAVDEAVSFEEEAGIDLVVMATHGRGDLARLAFPNLPEDLLRRGTAPVLTIRPAGVILEEEVQPDGTGSSGNTRNATAAEDPGATEQERGEA